MLTAYPHRARTPGMRERRRWAETISAITTGQLRPDAACTLRIPAANTTAASASLAAIAAGLRDQETPVERDELAAVVTLITNPASALYQPHPLRAAWNAAALAQRIDRHRRSD
jgi:hypothetical protein